MMQLLSLKTNQQSIAVFVGSSNNLIIVATHFMFHCLMEKNNDDEDADQTSAITWLFL